MLSGTSTLPSTSLLAAWHSLYVPSPFGVQATPARQQTAEDGVLAIGSDQNTWLPPWASSAKIELKSLLFEQSTSSVTITTERIALLRRKPYWFSSSLSARKNALYIDSRCDSKPQPAMPCGPKHWKASTVVGVTPSTSARLDSPSMLSSHGRGRSSASSSVDVGIVSMVSNMQLFKHAASVASAGGTPLKMNSPWRSRQLDICSLPASGDVAVHHWLPLSVVVTPMR